MKGRTGILGPSMVRRWLGKVFLVQPTNVNRVSLSIIVAVWAWWWFATDAMILGLFELEQLPQP